MAALSALPNEILSLVTNHLDQPRDILSLSLCSRRLHEFTKLDGWKAFLKGRFGLAGLDSDARNAVHGLTTLYRNWHRKAFVARYVEPTTKTTSLNTWEKKKWKGPQGQTMGYQPSIDSYEEMRGAWADRREVLAWSAGTHLVMRIKETAKEAIKRREEMPDVDSDPESQDMLDDYKNYRSWYTYKLPDSFEGRDDITALKLLRPHQKDSSFESVIFGTASGILSLLSADPKLEETREQSYSTGLRTIGSISISSAGDPLLAATLGDSSLALYLTSPSKSTDKPIEPISQVTPIVPGTSDGRLWSSSFISETNVAIGLGPSYEPIQVYDITPTGFLDQPLRKFNLDTKYWRGDRTDWGMQRSTSVYPILPIPAESQGGCRAGSIFLSGGYDGIIRLHDMRSPHGFETMFWDVTNDSSIYSLAVQGLERVVAGTSMHSMLKVFDLRFSGSHVYHVNSPSSTRPSPSKPEPKRQDITYNAIVNDVFTPISQVSGGWNLFLNPRQQKRNNGYRAHSSQPRTEDSPVYSLSIPSPTSHSLYAGVEGAILDLTFVSVLDEHPDPLFAPVVQRFTDSGHINVKASYDPSDDVLSLGMYEQGNEDGLGMQLMVQDGVAAGLRRNRAKRDSARFRGLDERWKDPSDDGDRWIRGQQPPPPPSPAIRHGGRGRGRGGRGRGRGRGGL